MIIFKTKLGDRGIILFFFCYYNKINVTNSGGDTPLHRAAFMGHSQVCEILIKYKAKVNQTNSDGDAPINRAAANKKDTVCKKY